jgi:hypothetical protein
MGERVIVFSLCKYFRADLCEFVRQLYLTGHWKNQLRITT